MPCLPSMCVLKCFFITKAHLHRKHTQGNSGSEHSNTDIQTALVVVVVVVLVVLVAMLLFSMPAILS